MVVCYLGRTLETKRSILGLLMSHKPTLTDISRHVGRSPSTIKQHLEELQAMGMIRYVEEAQLGRKKYYECVPYLAISETYRTMVKEIKA